MGFISAENAVTAKMAEQAGMAWTGRPESLSKRISSPDIRIRPSSNGFGGVVADGADSVAPLRSSRSIVSEGNGGGNGFHARLRALEVRMARIDERVIGIEKAMATRAWVPDGVVTASVIAPCLGIVLIKLFG